MWTCPNLPVAKSPSRYRNLPVAINSRRKGKTGELEWAAFMRLHFGVNARRGCQYAGGVDSPDVIGWEGTHAEVKRVERLNIGQSYEQSVRDSKGQAIPYVAHRKSREPWMITLKASDLLDFIECIKKPTPPEA